MANIQAAGIKANKAVGVFRNVNADTIAEARKIATPPSRGTGEVWMWRREAGPAIQPWTRARRRVFHVRPAEMSRAAKAVDARDQTNCDSLLEIVMVSFGVRHGNIASRE
jgi:hypothetical protein